MEEDISFEHFSDLVFKLGHPPRTNQSRPDGSRVPYTPDKIFQSWVNHLPYSLPSHTGKRLFRLLFPHEGARRRYGLKETKLSVELGRVLGLSELTMWDQVGGGGGAGCLGTVVEKAMKQRLLPETRSTLTLIELDDLLDQLAAPSTFSQMSQLPGGPLPQPVILQRLYRDSNLSPYAMSVLTQIILRDLRPLLCPIQRADHPSTMLRQTLTSAPEQLGLHSAMWVWSPVMARLYRDGKGCVDWCADTAEAMSQSGIPLSVAPGPMVGVNVQIPKCRKGRSVADAIKAFCPGSTPLCKAVFAETKYDGYRLQIHVESCGDAPKITIFSKSKRDSTNERRNAHAIILHSLGLSVPHEMTQHTKLAERAAGSRKPQRQVRSSVILEGEVLSWNEGCREGGRGPGIEEFWWLGAAGVTAEFGSLQRPSQNRHLCLAYYDILHLDGESLLKTSYEQRRRLLEQVTRPITGFCFLAERVPVSFAEGRQKAEKELRRVFQECVKSREEGLVLKADESQYIDSKLPWVKLKKDYIPNLGDCVDLVILGAGWDMDRARELRVDTSVYTTFYVGTMTNGDAVSRRCPPHFHFLFRVSYGMSRDQLEVFNDNIRLGRWGSKRFDKDDPWKRRLLGLSWKYTMPQGMVPPSVLFEQPLCAELMGAGFQKLPLSDLYELRWPRLMKIFEKAERPWTMALGAAELKAVAHLSLGYSDNLSPPPSPEDSLLALWRAHSSAVDIPDKLSPKRPSPQRRASAPGVIKMSPDSPVNWTPGELPSPFAKRSKVGRPFVEVEERENKPILPSSPTSSASSRFLPAPSPAPAPLFSNRLHQVAGTATTRESTGNATLTLTANLKRVHAVLSGSPLSWTPSPGQSPAAKRFRTGSSNPSTTARATISTPGSKTPSEASPHKTPFVQLKFEPTPTDQGPKTTPRRNHTHTVLPPPKIASPSTGSTRVPPSGTSSTTASNERPVTIEPPPTKHVQQTTTPNVQQTTTPNVQQTTTLNFKQTTPNKLSTPVASASTSTPTNNSVRRSTPIGPTSIYHCERALSLRSRLLRAKRARAKREGWAVIPTSL